MLISIIVPVYNRPDEVADLVKSLREQTDRNFQLVLVEDGSTVPCLDAVQQSDGSWSPVESPGFDLKYYRKDNEGRSIARNYGIGRADGDFLVFVDSDCILPPCFIERLRCELKRDFVDCYGGPDAAHESFTPVQKAINFAMTSFLTTGGIRGKKKSMEKFTPRTFNMGFSRKVYESVRGFREMFSEDIDMSMRIRNAGFRIALFPDVFVYHKRRGDLDKFWRQVHVFGMSRITLELIYPGSMKPVHWLPALFTLGVVGMAAGAFFSRWLMIPLVIYILALFISAVRAERDIKIAVLAVAASMVQLFGYGTGFIKAYVSKIIFGKGRDVQEEIEIRKGKNEKM